MSAASAPTGHLAPVRPAVPPVAVFTGTALVLGATAGFGLGLALLLTRIGALSLGGESWLALVQVHGWVQLFGFAGLFASGVGLHVFPRLRGAPLPSRRRQYAIYALLLLGVTLRALAQPLLDLPGRPVLLAAAAAASVAGSLLFAATALRILASGSNEHRRDELVIGAGVAAMPVAAALAAAASLSGLPLIEPSADARWSWLMLLGCLGTMVLGVWARLAPAFVAAPPYGARRLLAGAALWGAGSLGVGAALPAAPLVLTLGAIVLTRALGLWGPTIARQELKGHARLTRAALRSAFAWAVIGGVILSLAQLGPLSATDVLVASAARHAFGLGFISLAIYGVAARALPSFLGRQLWSPRLHAGTIIATNVAVALRVIAQVVDIGGATASALEASGILAYAAFLLFAANIVITLRRPRAVTGTQPIRLTERLPPPRG